MRRGLRSAALLAAVIGLSGCVWPSFRFGSDRTGFNPFEPVLGTGNVAQLVPAWTVPTGEPSIGDPVTVYGSVFVNAGRRLFAFDIGNGATRWSIDYGMSGSGIPNTAAPPTAAADIVYGGFTGYTVGFLGFTGGITKYNAETGAELGNVVIPLPPPYNINLVPGATTAGVLSGGSYYVGFKHCIGDGCSTGYLEISLDTWAAGPLNEVSGVPTVGGGHVYVGLAAFDTPSRGTNCRLAPPPPNPPAGQVCSPLWTYSVGGATTTIAYTPSALFVGAGDGNLYALGPAGCGAATCPPLWSGATGGPVASSPAVANGVVYVGSDDGKLYAFPATGCATSHCSPLWSVTTGGPIKSSPAVANGVVYVGSDDGRLYAIGAAGCGAPNCAPLWTSAAGAAVGSSPAVALGSVYVGRSDGTLTAYRLPRGPSAR
jgi:outer membrane protein assembly factor BamB